jgi:hypothetical protein
LERPALPVIGAVQRVSSESPPLLHGAAFTSVTHPIIIVGGGIVAKAALMMKSLHLLCGVLCAFALLAFGGAEHAGGFTGAIDVTGTKLQLNLAAPDRDTQKLVDVRLPVELLPQKYSQYFDTPLSAQADQYWNVVQDKDTHMTARQAVCDGKDGLQQQVAKVNHKLPSGVRLVVICNFAATGGLFAEQSGSTMNLAYQLTNNEVTIRVNTPATCNPGRNLFCPNDPQVTVIFVAQLITTVRTPSLCAMSAEDGTAIVKSISFRGDTTIGSLGLDLARLLFPNKAFPAAEEALKSFQKKVPLPFTSFFNDMHNSPGCTGKVPGVSRALTAFGKLETEINLRNRAIILRATHGGIGAPQVGVPDPSVPAPFPTVPSFLFPTITATQPFVKAGAELTVKGEHFPRNTNVATALPVSMDHGGYPGSSLSVCSGGWTDLEWGPVGRARIQQLRGDSQGRCPKEFNATGLTPGTGYQFRARDCDAVTCSPWSALRRVTTARIDPDWAKVVLYLEGRRYHWPLGTGTIDGNGSFTASMRIPSGTSAGMHTIFGVNRLNSDGRPATGTGTVQVTAAASSSGTTASQGTMLMVFPLAGETGCPNRPIISTVVDDTFMLSGSGFSPGPVAIHLDSQTGTVLGNATADASGAFCQKLNAPPRSQVGKHTLVAVANNAVVSRLDTEFVIPSGDPR